MRSGLRGCSAWWRGDRRRFAAFVMLLVVVAAALLPVGASAQAWSPPRTVFVPTTGHTTDGLFLDLWRAERPLLGDPVTEEFRARTGFTAGGEANVVQYYEHMALAYLPDAAPGEQVQPLDLGRQALDQAIDAGPTRALDRALERSVCAPSAESACASIVSTGHTVREPFLTYWRNGETTRWLGQPLTEAFFAPDRTRIQYFENGILRLTASGEVEPLPLGRIEARRHKVETQPIERPQDVPVHDEALFTPPPEATPTEAESETGSGNDWSFGPGPQQGAWKEIVVSISAQSMWAYEEGRLVMSSLVSTGTAEVWETTTPIGNWSILSKVDMQDMEGTISDEYYFVADVPNVMYFDNLGNALHGTYWHNNFGTPMSHGCVNLPLDVAAWMYEWAPVGTAVSVIG